jgi:hypothetical protein
MIRLTLPDRNGRFGVSRREWLRFSTAAMLAGGRAGAGVSADESPATRIPGFDKARSVLLIYASGGQSQIDLWDPKPDAPDTVRSIFRPISTAVPGMHFTDRLPGLAKIADKYTIVRSMSHADLDHGSATYLALTGRYHERLSSNPPVRPTDLPTYGAIVRKVGARPGFPYEAIHVNGPALVPLEPGPGQYAGLLGREYEPLLLGDVNRQRLAMPSIDPRDGLPLRRLGARMRLKEAYDNQLKAMEQFRGVSDTTQQYRQALEVLASKRVRNAFNLGLEKASIRDAYGRHRPGQACLLARRLVEAGVPFTTVIWNHSNRGQDLAPTETAEYGWDTHNDIFEALKVHLCPRFDATMVTLLNDLDQRGLLETTLVVCMGEFGRAPLVAPEPNFPGNAPGRKHWASAYSILMAGAGVHRGAVIGKTDRLGGDVITARYGPWDVAATMFSALGINPAGEYRDALDRPYPVSVGRPMTAIYS